jgi:predicted hotdog family 3-hydroxylacyl-ACP dehydratase
MGPWQLELVINFIGVMAWLDNLKSYFAQTLLYNVTFWRSPDHHLSPHSSLKTVSIEEHSAQNRYSISSQTRHHNRSQCQIIELANG